jgi:Hemerythrin HHE cation binding domain
MKRSDALVQLSRDHHHGLVVAQRLARATADTTRSARDAFLAFWKEDGHEHFRVEEELVLPALARHAPAGHEAVVRVLTDHVELRRLAADLGARCDGRDVVSRGQEHGGRDDGQGQASERPEARQRPSAGGAPSGRRLGRQAAITGRPAR